MPLNTILSAAFTVTHVILGNNQIAKTIQKSCKILIALGIFRNPMNDLNNTFHTAFRFPPAGMNLTLSAGRIRDITIHQFHPTTS